MRKQRGEIHPRKSPFSTNKQRGMRPGLQSRTEDPIKVEVWERLNTVSVEGDASDAKTMASIQRKTGELSLADVDRRPIADFEAPSPAIPEQRDQGEIQIRRLQPLPPQVLDVMHTVMARQAINA